MTSRSPRAEPTSPLSLCLTHLLSFPHPFFDTSTSLHSLCPSSRLSVICFQTFPLPLSLSYLIELESLLQEKWPMEVKVFSFFTGFILFFHNHLSFLLLSYKYKSLTHERFYVNKSKDSGEGYYKSICWTTLEFVFILSSVVNCMPTMHRALICNIVFNGRIIVGVTGTMCSHFIRVILSVLLSISHCTIILA